MVGYAGNRKVIQQRLRRIEGQVRGLQRMIDDDAYCIDVLTQVSAASRALQSVALELLGDHSHALCTRCRRGWGPYGGCQAERSPGGHREARAVVSPTSRDRVANPSRDWALRRIP